MDPLTIACVVFIPVIICTLCLIKEDVDATIYLIDYMKTNNTPTPK